MAVFKRKYKDNSGIEREYQKFSIDFYDHHNIRRRVAGFTNKSASSELERQILKLVSFRISGAGLDASMTHFLETCPKDIRECLYKWGIIEAARAAASKGLLKHVEDWLEKLKADGDTSKHVSEYRSKMMRLGEECKWNYLSDITSTTLNQWKNDQKGKLSSATINHYVKAVKGFCAWLKREKRLAENPVEYVSVLNAKKDRVLERRALEVSELNRLIEVTEAGPIVHGMTGMERSLLYRLAVTTGFRYSELWALTKASFNFEGETPIIYINSEDAKNDEDDFLPMRPELAEAVKAHIKDMNALDRIFPRMWKDKGFEMLKVDLEAAKIPYVDDKGLQADFHALRHTFGTLLYKSGVDLASAQRLMRHSKIDLTADIYTHIGLSDKNEQVLKLPVIGATQASQENTVDDGKGSKTGGDFSDHNSDHRRTDNSDADSMVTPVGTNSMTVGGFTRTYKVDGKVITVYDYDKAENEKTLIPQGDKGLVILAPPAGFEPATCGLTVRRSTS